MNLNSLSQMINEKQTFLLKERKKEKEKLCRNRFLINNNPTLIVGEQILTKLPIKPTHQLNKRRALEALPAIEKLLNIHQIPHPPLLHKHLPQIALEAPARLLGLVVAPLDTLLPPQLRNFGVGGGDGRRQWRLDAVGEARELPDAIDRLGRPHGDQPPEHGSDRPEPAPPAAVRAHFAGELSEGSKPEGFYGDGFFEEFDEELFAWFEEVDVGACEGGR